MVWHKGTIRRAVSECGVLLIIGFFAYTLVNKLLQFDAFKLNLARTGICSSFPENGGFVLRCS